MDQETLERIKEKAIEEVLKKYFRILEPREKVAMHRLLEELLESIMKGEREIFLEHDPDNKGNGYYPRSLSAGSFQLNLQVPRDRKGRFRPHILPEPYKRVDPSYVDFSEFGHQRVFGRTTLHVPEGIRASLLHRGDEQNQGPVHRKTP